MFKRMLSTAALVGVVLASSAEAGTATTTFQVSATVNNACSVTANALSFGTYTPLLGSEVDISGGVNLTCTLGSSFQIGLNAGATSGATVSTRQMTSGGNALSYALYRDATHLLNWGNTAGTDTLSGTGLGTSITYPVYGAIPASQSVPSGTYTDTITVTVTY